MPAWWLNTDHITLTIIKGNSIWRQTCSRAASTCLHLLQPIIKESVCVYLCLKLPQNQWTKTLKFLHQVDSNESTNLCLNLTVNDRRESDICCQSSVDVRRLKQLTKSRERESWQVINLLVFTVFTRHLSRVIMQGISYRGGHWVIKSLQICTKMAL